MVMTACISTEHTLFKRIARLRRHTGCLHQIRGSLGSHGPHPKRYFNHFRQTDHTMSRHLQLQQPASMHRVHVMRANNSNCNNNIPKVVWLMTRDLVFPPISVLLARPIAVTNVRVLSLMWVIWIWAVSMVMIVIDSTRRRGYMVFWPITATMMLWITAGARNAAMLYVISVGVWMTLHLCGRPWWWWWWWIKLWINV